MAKYQEISDHVREKFNEVLEETSIPTWVNFELLCNDKQKEVYVIRKSSDIIEHITNGVNFVVTLNEEIFEQLEDEQQNMLLHECLNGVVVDNEKDNVSLEKFDFTTYSGILVKYGHADVIRLKESVKSLYDEKKEREDQEKAMKKSSKKS